MGLCKCPKRKVTNLFCFEHRVNVCESCLLANHESCVVQTYLSWLTDSDYDANCLLCFEPLSAKETVRLKCLHLFHWDCFDARARQLPDTTAPAGYKCPSCLECIFPPENQQSPVVDKLRAKLQTVNWGRLGVGLPTLPELDKHSGMPPQNGQLHSNEDGTIGQHALQHIQHHPAVQGVRFQQLQQQQVPNDPSPHHQQHQQHQDPFEVNTFTARSKLLADSNGSLSSSVYIGNGNEAEDDSKYTKKAAERNLRTRLGRLPRPMKRLLAVVLVLAVLYVLLFTFGLWPAGGNSQEDDPLFDPHANPNVRVQARGDN